MSLSNQVDRFLVSLVTTHAAQTVTWYRKRLAPLRQIDKNIGSITLSDLQSLYAQLASQKARWVDHPSGRASVSGGLSPSTLRGYIRSWRAFFNWLVDDGVITCSPAAKLRLPQVPRQPPKDVSAIDMERIIEAAQMSGARDYAILCILADSAFRVSGLCSITLDNLDLDHAQAIVVEKGQTRFLLFSPRTVAAIRDYLIERPNVSTRALFVGKRRNPLTPGGVYQLLDRLAGAAQVTGRHNPHAFRHGWARAALALGADLGEVAQILGHQSVQTTYQYYGRWSTQELHRLHDAYTWLPDDT